MDIGRLVLDEDSQRPRQQDQAEDPEDHVRYVPEEEAHTKYREDIAI